jgi:hypothetical protein
MSERDPDNAGTTAEFRAFAAAGNAETQPPWSMRAPGRRVAVLAAVIIAVAIVLAIIALLVING